MGSHFGMVSMDPFITAGYKAQNCYIVRIVGRDGRHPWSNNTAVTCMLKMWHKADVSKWQAEIMMRSMLRSQGLPVNKVAINATVRVKTYTSMTQMI